MSSKGLLLTALANQAIRSYAGVDPPEDGAVVATPDPPPPGLNVTAVRLVALTFKSASACGPGALNAKDAVAKAIKRRVSLMKKADKEHRPEVAALMNEQAARLRQLEAELVACCRQQLPKVEELKTAKRLIKFFDLPEKALEEWQRARRKRQRKQPQGASPPQGRGGRKRKSPEPEALKKPPRRSRFAPPEAASSGDGGEALALLNLSDSADGAALRLPAAAASAPPGAPRFSPKRQFRPAALPQQQVQNAAALAAAAGNSVGAASPMEVDAAAGAEPAVAVSSTLARPASAIPSRRPRKAAAPAAAAAPTVASAAPAPWAAVMQQLEAVSAAEPAPPLLLDRAREGWAAGLGGSGAATQQASEELDTTGLGLFPTGASEGALPGSLISSSAQDLLASLGMGSASQLLCGSADLTGPWFGAAAPVPLFMASSAGQQGAASEGWAAAAAAVVEACCREDGSMQGDAACHEASNPGPPQGLGELAVSTPAGVAPTPVAASPLEGSTARNSLAAANSSLAGAQPAATGAAAAAAAAADVLDPPDHTSDREHMHGSSSGSSRGRGRSTSGISRGRRSINPLGWGSQKGLSASGSERLPEEDGEEEECDSLGLQDGQGMLSFELCDKVVRIERAALRRRMRKAPVRPRAALAAALGGGLGLGGPAIGRPIELSRLAPCARAH